jgi:hypothetical protein
MKLYEQCRLFSVEQDGWMLYMLKKKRQGKEVYCMCLERLRKTTESSDRNELDSLRIQVRCITTYTNPFSSHTRKIRE